MIKYDRTVPVQRQWQEEPRWSSQETNFYMQKKGNEKI